MIAAICYVTQGQVLDVAGGHVQAIRLVVWIAFARVLMRGELGRWQFNTIDWILVAYVMAITIVPTLRIGTFQEFLYEAGVFSNAVLAYLACASLVGTEDELRQVLAKVGWLLVPLTLLIISESYTGKNAFSILGGVDATAMFRDGHFRAAGAFRSPITAGSFGATFAMLFAGMLFAWPLTWAAVVGFASSIVIVICARSSGPLLGMLIGFVALGCWPLRRRTRQVRWALAAAVFGLHLVMKAPVWFLLSRISELVGGGGYHRAYLIDQFVNRFSSWWLVGTNDTGVGSHTHWVTVKVTSPMSSLHGLAVD